MRTGIRFRPPRVELSAELEWALARAFGPPVAPAEGQHGLDPQKALKLAHSFGLAERIGARASQELLTAELGDASAAAIREAAGRAAAMSMLAERVCGEVAAVGARLAVPVVFLKGAALQLAGTSVAGSRMMCDVDVLAVEEGARRLQAELMAAGCTAIEVPESDHQLRFLTHPSGFGIEVHHHIPGLRLESGRSATAPQLLAAKRCWRAPGMPEGCFVPDEQVLVAHLLVHGLAQHGMAPHAYPMTRMLADLQDLEGDEAMWRRFGAAGMRWVERDISRAEVAAVRALVERLGRGEAAGEVAREESGSALLLRHLVAGIIDPSYEKSLKFRGLVAKPRDVGSLRGLATTLRRTVLPTRAQIDLLYGRPRTRLGYWGRRLWRPFDLVGRAWRYGSAWWLHRMRDR